MNKFLRFFRHVRQSQPITIQGAIALALSALGYYWIAMPESDLIALVITGSIFTTVVATLAYCLAAKIFVARRIQAQLRFDTNNLLSRSEIAAGVILEKAAIPPYLVLNVRRRFAHEGAECPAHQLRGGVGRGVKRHLVDSVYFPHRGLWQVSGLEFELKDSLGFSSVSWFHEAEGAVEVSAPTIAIQPLPIVAASSRSGDELSQTRDRSGDLFDIKQYDPSDGIKRILWKTYARSRELVVRRPEPAIIPEGEVAVYVVANRHEDYVVGAAQSYINYLIKSDIVLLFGTDGLSESVSSQHAEYALLHASEEEIRHAFNQSVWTETAGTAKDFEKFLSSLQASNRVVQRVIVFGADRDAWYDTVAAQASIQGIALSVAIVPETFKRSLLQQTSKKRKPKRTFALRAKKDLAKDTPVIAAITSSNNEALVCEPYQG